MTAASTNGTTRRALGRQDIIAAPDLTTEWVDVPEWGEGAGVYVRSLTALQRDQVAEECVVGRGKHREITTLGMQARFLVRAIVDEHGTRLFSNRDAEALQEKSAGALARIFDVVARLSGISDEDVEELAGNSGMTQNGASVSD